MSDISPEALEKFCQLANKAVNWTTNDVTICTTVVGHGLNTNRWSPEFVGFLLRNFDLVLHMSTNCTTGRELFEPLDRLFEKFKARVKKHSEATGESLSE